MDELVLMDEDMMDLPPEDLPRRVLSDFAVYNSEGFCSSLELLPMWSGVDPDVDLYASGNVLDDDGEWAGGQALSAGKASNVSPSATVAQPHVMNGPSYRHEVCTMCRSVCLCMYSKACMAISMGAACSKRCHHPCYT